MALNTKTSILIRHRRENTERKGKGQVKTDTLIRVIHSQAKEYRKPLEPEGIPEAARSWKKKGILP